MKETIKDLQEEHKKLKEKYYNRHLFHKEFPEWVQANEKVNLARQELNAVERKIWPEVDKLEHECGTRMREIEAKIKELQSKRTEEFPKEIVEWVYNVFAAGRSYGYGQASKPNLVWLSEDHKYGILCARGGQGWVGRGTFAYTPTRYWAIEIFSPHKREITSYGDERFEGRLTKEKKQQLIDEIYKIVNK